MLPHVIFALVHSFLNRKSGFKIQKMAKCLSLSDILSFFYDQAPLCYFFTGIPIIFLIIIIVITELTVQSIDFPSINQKEISSSQPLSLREGGSGVISSNGEAFQL